MLPHRPPNIDSGRIASLPLGEAVQHLPQAHQVPAGYVQHDVQVGPGHRGVHQVAEVVPVSHEQHQVPTGRVSDLDSARIGKEGVHQVVVAAPVSLQGTQGLPLDQVQQSRLVGAKQGAKKAPISQLVRDPVLVLPVASAAQPGTVPTNTNLHGGGVHQDAAIAPVSHQQIDSLPDQVDVQPIAEILIPAILGEHFSGEQHRSLNPEAETFQHRDPDLVHNGKLTPDICGDWDHVQQVQAGGVGDPGTAVDHLWNCGGVGTNPVDKIITNVYTNSGNQPEPELPFQSLDDLEDVLGQAPKQIHKVNKLLDLVVKMPSGQFMDKALPASENTLLANTVFTADYYVALHNITVAPGIKGDGTVYPAFTPNHLGARVRLPHVKLNIERWRHHLIGYEHAELVQLLEFGFPLGLSSVPELGSCTRNHGSAYMWFSHVDKFICTEVTEGGMTGPFGRAPWWGTIVSPLMTAHKKVRSRRTVFDATFGDKSLNNSTPSDLYMGLPCKYTFPKIEDYKTMILNSGQGAFMWKRDLSRFFLQLPLDPVEYSRVGVIWRGLFFIFVGLAFGLRHSGLQGQRVTDAVCWILRGLGRDEGVGQPYQACNYVDDVGGVEADKSRATAAFNKLGWLLTDLGLAESLKESRGSHYSDNLLRCPI